MARIAEIRELDGDIWVKIDGEALASDDGKISLYTPKEIEQIKRVERNLCAEVCEGEKYLRYDIAAAIISHS